MIGENYLNKSEYKRRVEDEEQILINHTFIYQV